MLKIAGCCEDIILDMFMFRGILVQIILYTQAIDQDVFLTIFKHIRYMLVFQKGSEIFTKPIVSTRKSPENVEHTQIFYFRI